MMLLCDVVLFTNVSLEELSSPQFHDNVVTWASSHGSSVMGNYLGSGAPEGEYYVHIDGCFVKREEIDACGILSLGPYKAYITNFKGVRDTPEKSIHESLKEFLNEVFDSNNFSETERNAALNMTLRQFIDTWDNILQTGITAAPSTESVTHQLGVPRSYLISWPSEVICPECHNKGSIKIVDGNVHCTKCHASFGDIDNMKE